MVGADSASIVGDVMAVEVEVVAEYCTTKGSAAGDRELFFCCNLLVMKAVYRGGGREAGVGGVGQEVE